MSLPIISRAPSIGLTFFTEDPPNPLPAWVSGHLGTWKGCCLTTWAKGLPW